MKTLIESKIPEDAKPPLYAGLARDEMDELRVKKLWTLGTDSLAIKLISNYLERENYKAAHETIELVRMKREKEKKDESELFL